MASTPTTQSKGKSLGALAFFILLPLSVGFVGSMLTSEHIDGWYATADKAPWNPPNSVFGPVWTVLYILIGIAGWLIWKNRDRPGTARLMNLYWVQLVLNAIWSPLFFGGYASFGVTALWIAFAVILALIITVVLLIAGAFKHGFKAAALLLIPYLLWGAYASTLNLYLALFN